MGTLHPEMTNCFNPNGNPTFNQFVVGALGSKNMKMVLVRAKLKPDGLQEPDGSQEIVAIEPHSLRSALHRVPAVRLQQKPGVRINLLKTAIR